MKKEDAVPGEGSGLCRHAEQRITTKRDVTGQTLTLEESQQLIEELKFHQAELEIRNEELRQTRSQLQDALSRYANLYDFAPMGYVTLNRDGTILAVNLTGADLLGGDRSGLINSRMENFISGQSRAAFADFLESVFAGAPKDACDVKMENKEKSPSFFRFRAAVDESGRECRATFFDVTERLKLEQQLLQAQKMESVGLLAGGVAHDFNNMLTAIIGYGETIRDNIAADEELLRESIELVLKAAGRASELTGRLLAFSRKQVTQAKPVVIDAVIEDISKLIRRVIGADIEYSFAFSCNELLVMADVGQLEMALMNLATNARDAMPQGGRLSISTREVLVEEGAESHCDLPAPGRFALVSVSDTGAGIAEDSMDRLFEPFYTTKETGKGTGLGLAIVHGIMKQHGGSVQVSSVPGNGTTFSLYLPLIVGRVNTPEPKAQVRPAGGSETVLVAEDEELVRCFTKRILERAGYRVITAANGEDALDRFTEHDDISLVLSDMVMPGKTGKEIFEEIRRMKPEVKFILVSGYSPDILQDKGLYDKGLQIITKPFLKNELLQKIRDVLDGV